MNTPDLVGECGFVDNDYQNLFLPDRLWQALPLSPAMSFEWLNEYLQWEPIRKRVRDSATGTSNSMKNISKENFMSLDVPIPASENQERIFCLINSINLSILAEQDTARKLELLKAGGMADALSGRNAV